MAKYGKWIGAGLGFVMGGPIGALFGFFIGSTFDSTTVITSQQMNDLGSRPTGRGDFLLSLVVLATALMKADGKVTRNELDFVKKFFRDNFGPEGEREALAIVKDLLNKEIEVDQVCNQIRMNMNVYSRTQLLYFLFGLAKADGTVCKLEISLLDRISNLLGIDTTTYQSIKAMYYDDLESAYSVLGISSSATDDEIKKAYRKMAIENHPDKVGYMGEDIRKAAEKKFMAINEAYEKIKKQRGIG